MERDGQHIDKCSLCVGGIELMTWSKRPIPTPVPRAVWLTQRVWTRCCGASDRSYGDKEVPLCTATHPKISMLGGSRRAKKTLSSQDSSRKQDVSIACSWKK